MKQNNKAPVHSLLSRLIMPLFILFIFLFVLSGCYWTPEEDNAGSISVSLGLQTSVVAPEEFEFGFLVFTVIDENLAESGDDEVFDVFFDGEDDSFFDDSSYEVSFPGGKVRVEIKNSISVGSKGSVTFDNLRADRRYLVIVQAAQCEVVFYGEEDYDIYCDGWYGLNRATVKAGEVTRVSLRLDKDAWDFCEVLSGWYGFDVEECFYSFYLGGGE